MRLFPRAAGVRTSRLLGREYWLRLEAACREHGRGPVKRNSVNYGSSVDWVLNFLTAGFVSCSCGVEGGYR
jgi:hypothetical protein